MVPAASAALVSCERHCGHAGDGTRADLDDSVASQVPRHPVLHRYRVGAGRNL